MTMGRKRSFVCGVGNNDYKSQTSINGKHIPEYKMWANMLFRVYDTKFKGKHPTYLNTACDPKWHSMTAFIEDVSAIDNYDKAIHEGWCLDKDILIKGNKLYSKTTCCFVPPQLNNIILQCNAKRGEFYIGVSYSKHAKKFRSYLIDQSRAQRHLGYFDNEFEAFSAYCKAKKQQIIDVTENYKGIISNDVYNALLAWEICTDD